MAGVNGVVQQQPYDRIIIMQTLHAAIKQMLATETDKYYSSHQP